MQNHSILTLAVGAIIIDTIIACYLFITKKGGTYIKEWYKSFTIGAYIMDILSIIIGTYIATLFTSNLYKQLVIVILIGLIHDLTFGYFVSNTGIKSKIFNLFNNYAKELGIIILIVDALMLISTLILSNFLHINLSNNNIYFLGVLTFYIGLLIIYSF